MEENDKISKYLPFAKWTALFILCGVYLLRTTEIFLFQGGDNAHYVLLAKAIALGKGYKDIFIPGMPAHTQYPPMFPLMLSAIIALFGTYIYLMKMLVSAGAAISFLFTYLLLRRRRFVWSLAAVLWLGCSISFFIYSDKLLTESVFMAFSFSSLFAAVKWLENRKWSSAAAMVLLCWAAELTRTAGVVLAVAIGFTVFLQLGKSRKAALQAIGLTAICLIPVVLWALRNMMVSDVATNYLQQLFAASPTDNGGINIFPFILRFWTNIKVYFIDASNVMGTEWTTFPSNLIPFASLMIWALILLGFYHHASRDWGITETYTVLYLIMVIAWPFSNYRFMMPLYPLLIAYAIQGGYFIISKISKKWPATKTIATGAVVVPLISIIIFNAMLSYTYNKTVSGFFETNKIKVKQNMYMMTGSARYRRMLNACVWLAQDKKADGIVMARKPRLVALTSGLMVVPCPKKAPADPNGWIRENTIRYIIVDEVYPHATGFMRALTAGRNNMPDVRIIFRDGNTFVVELAPAPFRQ